MAIGRGRPLSMPPLADPRRVSCTRLCLLRSLWHAGGRAGTTMGMGRTKKLDLGEHPGWGEMAWLIALCAVVLAGLSVAAWYMVEPAPPTKVTIAAGPDDGAYYAFAQQYAEFFAERGIELEVLETAGTPDNIARLLADRSEADLAIVQAGVADREQARRLEALVRIGLEPVWLFHRAELEINRMTDLRGRRIAAGLEDSGTRIAAEQWLTMGGVAEGEDGTELITAGNTESRRLLLAGEVDAAIVVLSPQAPIIASMVDAPELALYSVQRATAYSRRLPHMTPVTLPAGVFDFAADRPPRDTRLLANSALIVAGPGLHDGIVQLAIDAAKDVHGEADLLGEPGRFPDKPTGDIPISSFAEHYLRHGPNWLQRQLPFWAATLVARAWIVILPLLTLAIPLIRMLPPVYNWRIRARVYRWYKRIRRIDDRAGSIEDVEQLRLMLDELSRIEDEVGGVRVPLSYMDQYYDLRFHLRLVRGRIEEHLARIEGRAPASVAAGEGGASTAAGSPAASGT